MAPAVLAASASTAATNHIAARMFKGSRAAA